MLWREDQIAILDHEKCFGHLVLSVGEARPWRSFLGTRPLLRHCLRMGIEVENGLTFGNRIHQELIGLELEERIPALLAEALDRSSDLDDEPSVASASGLVGPSRKLAQRAIHSANAETIIH